MIDITKEKCMPFSAVVRVLPTPLHVGSIHRWASRGCRGIRLESILIGGRRMTSREALQRFIEAVSVEADASVVPAEPKSARSKPGKRNREQSIKQAERSVERMGL